MLIDIDKVAPGLVSIMNGGTDQILFRSNYKAKCDNEPALIRIEE